MNERTAAHTKASWPVDHVDTEKGEVRISGKYVYPKQSDHAAYIGLAAAGVALVLIGTVGTAGLNAGEVFGRVATSAIFLGAPIALVVLGIVYFFMRRNLDVTITFDAIRIGGKTYPRNVPIEFSVVRHYKAAIEEERNRPSRTYRRAIEAIMRYGEQRVTIAEMRERDQEKATALIIRMQHWCERFDAAMAQAAREMAPGAETVAAGDFGPAPDVR